MKIITVMNQIGEDIVEEADSYSINVNKKRISRVYSQIAALCVVMVVIISGSLLFINSPFLDNSKSDIIANDDTFHGIIMQVWDSSVLVKVTGGWALNSSDLISVPIDNSDMPPEVGMEISVGGFGGMIMESYPAQITKPSVISWGESNLPMFGELYDYENYCFGLVCEEYYEDIIIPGGGFTETIKNNYTFSENSDEFYETIRELLFSAKPLKNVGYHDYFFRNQTARMEIVTSLGIEYSSVFSITVEESGWLRVNDDMFFVGEEKAAEFIKYVRKNGTVVTLSTEEPQYQTELIVGYKDDIDSALYEGRTPIKYGAGDQTVLIFSNKEWLVDLKLCEVSYNDESFYLGKTVFSLSYLSNGYYIEYSTQISETIPNLALVTEDTNYLITYSGLDGRLSATPAKIIGETENLWNIYNDSEKLNDYFAEVALADGAGLIAVDSGFDFYKDIAVKYPDESEAVALCDAVSLNNGAVSPNKTKISYIIASPQDDYIGPMYIYDVSERTKTLITEFDKFEENLASKMLFWLDDEILLVTAGFSHGTVTRGGDIYYYNVNTGENGKIINSNTAFASSAELTRMELAGDYLNFGVCVIFNDATGNFNYTDRILVTQVYDLINNNETFDYEGVVINNQS